MSARTVFLSRLIGVYCILAALTMFLRGEAFVDAVIALLHDPPSLLLLGLVTAAAGLALVFAHNVWSGGAATVIVTAVGWGTLAKGLMFLALPPAGESAFLLQTLHYREYFQLFAALSFAIGAYLTWCGFSRQKVARSDSM
jgi:hypothetical protein